MCHFITAVLPPSVQTSSIATIFKKHGRALRPLESESIQAQLRPGEGYFVTTNGHCDCGTGLGASLRRSRSRRRGGLDSQVEKLRRKGWSAAKIARWLQQHDEQQMAQSRKGDLSGGVDDWIELLNEIITSRLSTSVCLLLHSYGGPLNEPIKLSARKVIRKEEITSEALGAIEEDILYEFKA
jgi:hypothetical protein